MSLLADQVRRSLSGTSADCTCPLDVAETLRRFIGGREELCAVHEVAAIEQRAADDAVTVARERVDHMRAVVADQAAGAPVCTCGDVVAAVHRGLAGEVEPVCGVHTVISAQIVSTQMNTPIGDDHSLLAMLSDKLGRSTPIVNL